MKCAVGDLALVIGGPKENHGKMVTCRVPVTGLVSYEGWRIFIGPVPGWMVDTALMVYGSVSGFSYVPFALDAWLLPIRPERDEDLEETQRRAGYYGQRGITATYASLNDDGRVSIVYTVPE